MPVPRIEQEARRGVRIETESYGTVELGYSAPRDLNSPEEILQEGKQHWLYVLEARTRIDCSDPSSGPLVETIMREWLRQNGFSIVDADYFSQRGIDVGGGIWAAVKYDEFGVPTIVGFRGGRVLDREGAEHALLGLQLAAFHDVERLVGTAIEPAIRQSSLWFAPFSTKERMDSSIREHKRHNPDFNQMPPGDLRVELRFNIPEGVDISGLSAEEKLRLALENFAGMTVTTIHDEEIVELDNTQLAFILQQIFYGYGTVASGGPGTAMGHYGVGENFHAVQLHDGSFFVVVNQPTYDEMGNTVSLVRIAKYEDYGSLVAWMRAAYKHATGM